MPKHALFEQYQKDILFYERVLRQQPKDKHKIYSLHEPGVYCVGKGKDHKAYEYDAKASVVATQGSQVIIGVTSHDENERDSKTLQVALSRAHDYRSKEIELAGYTMLKALFVSRNLSL